MSSRPLQIALICLSAAACLLPGCRGSGPADNAPPPPLAWGAPGETNGRFHSPRVVLALHDRIYVADKTQRIQVFDPYGKWLATWPLEKLERGFPTGMAAAPNGCVAVADTHNHRVLIFSPDGRILRTIGREGGGHGEFTYVTDVAFDPDGFIYVSEHGREDRVQKFDPQGNYVSAWGGQGDAPGRFRRPQALAIDAQGFIYVADCANHRVQKFTRQGKFIAAFGEFGKAPGQLYYPYGLAIGPGNMLIVCEYGNNRLQCFDRNGRSLGVISGPGRGPGQLASPWAVTWLDHHGLYVADCGNHRIQCFRLPPDLNTQNHTL